MRITFMRRSKSARFDVSETRNAPPCRANPSVFRIHAKRPAVITIDMITEEVYKINYKNVDILHLDLDEKMYNNKRR